MQGTNNNNNIIISLIVYVIHVITQQLKEIGGAFDQQAEEWISQKKKEKTDYIKSQFKQVHILLIHIVCYNNVIIKLYTVCYNNVIIIID